MPSALLLYHYFQPDDVVSSLLFTQLGEGLAERGWCVTAMPCNRSWHGNHFYPAQSNHAGIAVERIWRPAFPQHKSWGRLLNTLWMLVAWSLKSLTTRADLVIIGTDPIMSAAIALPWKKLRPTTQIAHWCFDLYPEAAVADGLLPNGRVPSLLRSLMRAAYQRVDLIADIGSCMRQRLSSYDSPARTATLPPWALTAELNGPSAIDPSHRAAAFGEAKLGLLYSGSFGRAHSYTEILTIARLLRDADVHLSFGIRGNCVSQVKESVTNDDRNISFAPFVPHDQLEARLSSADIHIVSLRPEWTGTVVPSKFFGALAVGRPVLFIGSDDCSVAQIIRQHGVGWVCVPGQESQVAGELRKLANNPWRLQAIRENCYQTYKTHFSRETTISRFDTELRALIGQPTETAIPATVGAR